MIKLQLFDYGNQIASTLSFNNKSHCVRTNTKGGYRLAHVSMVKKIQMIKALKKAMFK